MKYLLDTSVLARLANQDDARYRVASQATVELHRRKDSLHITPQNLIEFRAAATRPAVVNGLGFSTQEVDFQSALFEANFPLLVDIPTIFPIWKSIVQSLQVIGKQVHDARLLAVCHAHQVSHILTFNTGHFKRLAAFGTAITVVDPNSLVSP